MEAILQQILSELKDLKANQIETNARLDKVDARLDAIEGRQAALSKDMIQHNHVVEPLLKIISKNADGMTERNRQVDRLEDKVEGHDHRIWALEQLATAK